MQDVTYALLNYWKMKTLSFFQIFPWNKTIKMQAVMKNLGIRLDFQMPLYQKNKLNLNFPEQRIFTKSLSIIPMRYFFSIEDLTIISVSLFIDIYLHRHYLLFIYVHIYTVNTYTYPCYSVVATSPKRL